jgi:hypothetical protein
VNVSLQHLFSGVPCHCRRGSDREGSAFAVSVLDWAVTAGLLIRRHPFRCMILAASDRPHDVCLVIRASLALPLHLPTRPPQTPSFAVNTTPEVRQLRSGRGRGVPACCRRTKALTHSRQPKTTAPPPLDTTRRPASASSTTTSTHPLPPQSTRTQHRLRHGSQAHQQGTHRPWPVRLLLARLLTMRGATSMQQHRPEISPLTHL